MKILIFTSSLAALPTLTVQVGMDGNKLDPGSWPEFPKKGKKNRMTSVHKPLTGPEEMINQINSERQTRSKFLDDLVGGSSTAAGTGSPRGSLSPTSMSSGSGVGPACPLPDDLTESVITPHSSSKNDTHKQVKDDPEQVRAAILHLCQYVHESTDLQYFFSGSNAGEKESPFSSKYRKHASDYDITIFASNIPFENGREEIENHIKALWNMLVSDNKIKPQNPNFGGSTIEVLSIEDRNLDHIWETWHDHGESMYFWENKYTGEITDRDPFIPTNYQVKFTFTEERLKDIEVDVTIVIVEDVFRQKREAQKSLEQRLVSFRSRAIGSLVARIYEPANRSVDEITQIQHVFDNFIRVVKAMKPSGCSSIKAIMFAIASITEFAQLPWYRPFTVEQVHGSNKSQDVFDRLMDDFFVFLQTFLGNWPTNQAFAHVKDHPKYSYTRPEIYYLHYKTNEFLLSDGQGNGLLNLDIMSLPPGYPEFEEPVARVSENASNVWSFVIRFREQYLYNQWVARLVVAFDEAKQADINNDMVKNYIERNLASGEDNSEKNLRTIYTYEIQQIQPNPRESNIGIVNKHARANPTIPISDTQPDLDKLFGILQGLQDWLAKHPNLGNVILDKVETDVLSQIPRHSDSSSGGKAETLRKDAQNLIAKAEHLVAKAELEEMRQAVGNVSPGQLLVDVLLIIANDENQSDSELIKFYKKFAQELVEKVLESDTVSISHLQTITSKEIAGDTIDSSKQKMLEVKLMILSAERNITHILETMCNGKDSRHLYRVTGTAQRALNNLSDPEVENSLRDRGQFGLKKQLDDVLSLANLRLAHLELEKAVKARKSPKSLQKKVENAESKLKIEEDLGNVVKSVLASTPDKFTAKLQEIFSDTGVANIRKTVESAKSKLAAADRLKESASSPTPVAETDNRVAPTSPEPVAQTDNQVSSSSSNAVQAAPKPLSHDDQMTVLKKKMKDVTNSWNRDREESVHDNENHVKAVMQNFQDIGKSLKGAKKKEMKRSKGPYNEYLEALKPAKMTKDLNKINNEFKQLEKRTGPTADDIKSLLHKIAAFSKDSQAVCQNEMKLKEFMRTQDPTPCVESAVEMIVKFVEDYPAETAVWEKLEEGQTVLMKQDYGSGRHSYTSLGVLAVMEYDHMLPMVLMSDVYSLFTFSKSKAEFDDSFPLALKESPNWEAFSQKLAPYENVFNGAAHKIQSQVLDAAADKLIIFLKLISSDLFKPEKADAIQELVEVLGRFQVNQELRAQLSQLKQVLDKIKAKRQQIENSASLFLDQLTKFSDSKMKNTCHLIAENLRAHNNHELNINLLAYHSFFLEKGGSLAKYVDDKKSKFSKFFKRAGMKENHICFLDLTEILPEAFKSKIFPQREDILKHYLGFLFEVVSYIKVKYIDGSQDQADLQGLIALVEPVQKHWEVFNNFDYATCRQSFLLQISALFGFKAAIGFSGPLNSAQSPFQELNYHVFRDRKKADNLGALIENIVKPFENWKKFDESKFVSKFVEFIEDKSPEHINELFSFQDIRQDFNEVKKFKPDVDLTTVALWEVHPQMSLNPQATAFVNALASNIVDRYANDAIVWIRNKIWDLRVGSSPEKKPTGMDTSASDFHIFRFFFRKLDGLLQTSWASSLNTLYNGMKVKQFDCEQTKESDPDFYAVCKQFMPHIVRVGHVLDTRITNITYNVGKRKPKK